MKNYLLALTLFLGTTQSYAPVYHHHKHSYHNSHVDTDIFAAAICAVGFVCLLIVSLFVPDNCTRCRQEIPRNSKQFCDAPKRAFCGHVFHNGCYDSTQSCEACAEERVQRAERAARKAQQAVRDQERLYWQQQQCCQPCYETTSIVIIR